MTTQNLLVELLVEELPPKALKKLGLSFGAQLLDTLRAQGLCTEATQLTTFASPRRLAAHITQVHAQAPDRAVQTKLMPASVGLDAQGQPSVALLKKLQSMGLDGPAVQAGLSQIKRMSDGKADVLYYDSVVSGATLTQGLQQALEQTLAKLPIPKVMSYQLHSGCEFPGWSSVSFVRPAHGLIALHGATVVPVQALGLTAGRCTKGHRFEASVEQANLRHADSYAQQLLDEGAVIASFEERRAEIVRQLAQRAAELGGGCTPITDEALLDEVTALVERPHVLICEFEKQFLEVPQECLILTMKANQKYFPLLSAAGKLTNKFLVVSNISPVDASAVVQGNERVVRPRLADAKFFFDQDRKKTLASRLPGLTKVVYHNKLGTQAQRSERVCAIALRIVQLLRDAVQPYSVQTKDEFDMLAHKVQQAAQLAKADLLTDMVGEFPELQGIMGGYYARHEGLREGVAIAIEDHYKPRFAGDELPRNRTGTVVALADKLETLAGMFGIGNLPTGDKDPFALRRHALGVVRMLVELDLPLQLPQLLAAAFAAFPSEITDHAQQHISLVQTFVYERLTGTLREQGYSAQEVDAVLALQPQRLGEVPRRLVAVRSFAALPESVALAAANKRITNILKKSDDVDAHVSLVLLQEPAEQALHQALQTLLPQADALFDQGNYTGSLQALAGLREPVDAFFEHVMVNATELDVRLNRLGLLKSLHQAMNRVADLSRLA